MRVHLFLVVPMLMFSAALSDEGERSEEGRPDPYPLGEEMVQLEKDLSTAAYRESILAIRNHNELNGEIGRVDLPDNAARFRAAHGGPDALATNGALKAAYERRVRIERLFLELMRSAYVRIGRVEMYRTELARVRKEAAASTATARVFAEALSIEPVLPGPGAETQWPRWRGPSGQGLSEETNLPSRWSPEENVAWRTTIPGSGNSSPVIWDDRIFLTTAFDKGTRRCLVSVRRGNGKLLWVKDAPFVEPEGRVVSKNGYASATPVVDGERVITFFGNTGLVAFDFEGQVLWHVPMGPFDAMHGTGASPVVTGDLAILFQEQSDRPSIGIAVDKRSGEVRWRTERQPALGWCTPLPLRVGGREELLYGASHTLVSYDPRNGKELWHSKGPTREVIPSVAYGHGLVFCCSGRNGPTLAIRPGGSGDIESTRLAWRVVRGSPHVPSPVLSGQLLFLVNDTGILTCLEAKTGKTVYQRRLKGRFSASPLAADGKLYLTNERGETFVVRDGREFELLATNTIGEKTLASMAVLGGRIYLRGEEHLFAIQ